MGEFGGRCSGKKIRGGFLGEKFQVGLSEGPISSAPTKATLVFHPIDFTFQVVKCGAQRSLTEDVQVLGKLC